MNELLELKGAFEHRGNSRSFGKPSFPVDFRISSKQLDSLRNQLARIHSEWASNNTIGGALVSVHYKRVVPKSLRISHLLSVPKNEPDPIRGARFDFVKTQNGELIPKHVFTLFVPLKTLQQSMDDLRATSDILNDDFGGSIERKDAESSMENISFENKAISKSKFQGVLRDGFNVERFDIDRFQGDLGSSSSLVSLFKTGIETKEMLHRLGISVLQTDFLDDNTVRLSRSDVEVLQNQAPHLVAMQVEDLQKVPPIPVGIETDKHNNRILPHPTNEPIVGVIDTLFDKNAYFNEWVEFHDMVSDSVARPRDSYLHGTAVSSIIVDGPRGNPDLEDHCGLFRVRHFGVITELRFSSFHILKMIRQIVATNTDIKVWNLSLGSDQEINPSYISPEAAELDRIQKEFDVLFVVAGTNLPRGSEGRTMRLGAPADSLNAVVVNSVCREGTPASYSRCGPVLSFFNKPDVCYFGGDEEKEFDYIVVNDGSLCAKHQIGTSFAAPWIARKLAFLVCKMGMTREVAKALLIDSAAGWKSLKDVRRKGFGLVPKSINEILTTNEDEIRFFLTGTAEDYTTYNYRLPVPIVNGRHPFRARATLVYFPWCDRNQGVDYTNTEMDIHFGRVLPLGNSRNADIDSLNGNSQGDESGWGTHEIDARKLYRKWDNVKRISDTVKQNLRPVKAYGKGFWGVRIDTKERKTNGHREKLSFGIVVTLKEIRGQNRIEDFIQKCQWEGWIVNRISINVQSDVFAKSQLLLPLED